MQDNENLDLQSLIDKYENMLLTGTKIYFDADEFALLADYYFSLDDYTFADNIVDDGLKIHPGNPALIVLKAKILVSLEQYSDALEYINGVSDNSDIEFVAIKVEVLFHNNKADEANELIESTIDSNLSIEDLYVFITELGYIMNDIDDFDRAIYYLEQSLKIDDSNDDVFVDLSYAYEMKYQYDKAIEYNNLLLDINPYSYDGWINLGKLYSLNEQFDKAIDAFDFAATINEGDIAALKMKALSMFLNDNTTGAIDIFKEYIELNPDDEVAYDSIIEGYESLEDYDSMLEFINLKEKRFGSKGIDIKRAFVEIQRDNITEAWKYYEQVLDEDKDTFEYYMLEGELYFIDDNMRASEAAYIKALLVSENNIDAIDRLANVSVAQDKYEQAAEYLDHLLELDPDYPTAKARLAFVRFEIGAKEPFDEIMSQFSDDELRKLVAVISGNEEYDYSKYSRENMLVRINEARENRILFKNIKY